MKYTTFEGKKVDTNTVDHQHLSNMYWFSLIFLGYISEGIKTRINDEFNGDILPYKPKPRFIMEINSLERRGMLIWKEVNGIKSADIFYNGHIIGEYIPMDSLRELTINDLLK